MFIHFYLSNETLFDLIRYRLLDAYRPIAGPVAFGAAGNLIYMDGLENVSIGAGYDPARTTSFAINVSGPSSTPVVPAPGPVASTVPAVVLDVSAQLFTIAAADLPTAPAPGTGVFPRPARTPVPLAHAKIALEITIDPTGAPLLSATMYRPPDGIDPTGPLWQTLSGFATISIPLPLGSALSGVVGPKARLLNAGIAPTSNDKGYAIRFEGDDGQLPAPQDRLAAWNTFFAGKQASQLGIRQWAAEVPTAYLLQTASGQFDQQMQSRSVEKIFTNYDPSVASWTWDEPQLTLQKHGVFEHACAGIDIRAVMTVTVSFSVPAGNTLRVGLHVDIDKDDWDSFKCAAFSVLNPIAGIITAFDNSSLLPWYGAIGVAVLSRVGVPLVVLALALTNNAFLISAALKVVQDEVAKSGIKLIRTSDTDCYVDVELPLGGLGTAAWLTLQEVAGFQDHLVLRGDYRPPKYDVPVFVQGTLIKPFGNWKKPNCEAPRKSIFEVSAVLDFSVFEPSGRIVPSPVLTAKCGIDPASGGTVCWRFVDDGPGVYSRYDTYVNWSGAGFPGVFEVTIKRAPDAFYDAPYPMHLQIFSSFGTRQFNVPAPPPGPKLPTTQEEIILEAARRIAECYAKSSLISRIKALQVLWLPYPQPDYKAAQHWLVQIDGLAQDEWIRAWDAETRTLLAEVRASGDFAEISLMIDREPVRVMQITRGDQPLLSMDEYRRLSAGVAGTRETAVNEVRIQQTELLPLAEYPLPSRADGVHLRVTGDGLSIFVWDRDVMWQIAMQPRNYKSWTMTRLDEPVEFPSPLPEGAMRMSDRVHEGRPLAELFSAAGKPIGRFFVRPWYDRGSVSGRFYARLNAARDRVLLYARCLPRFVEPQIGDDDGGPVG